MMKKSIKAAFCSILVIIMSVPAEAKVLLVGREQSFKTIYEAAGIAQPGDTIIIKPGVYGPEIKDQFFIIGSDTTILKVEHNIEGEGVIRNLKGNSSGWITIIAEKAGSVILFGGADAMHFSNPAYLRIEGMIFMGQTGNGLNIDDGGNTESPAHHIVIDNCEWRGMNAKGNNDELKLSGLDDFMVRNCRFKNGSPGGSLIDMVGCHNGVIERNVFSNGGSNSIQVKGGSEKIIIQKNLFENGGERAVNIGGSTGLQFFRPAGAAYEASSVSVWSNIFTGGGAAVAYVGANDCEVVNNTIIKPSMWVLRILQENRSSGMKACSENRFYNNIVVFEAPGRPAVNTGPNTMPESFSFSNNLWYNTLDKNWKGPNTPVPDKYNIVNTDPEISNDGFKLKPDSPAFEKGLITDKPDTDFYGNNYRKKRSIGATEYKQEK